MGQLGADARTAPLLAELVAGAHTIRGISIGGIHTSIHLPQFGTLLDCGLAPRSWVGARRLLLSHGHLDHSGALPAFLGLRALLGHTAPFPVILPSAIEDDVTDLVEAAERLARHEIPLETIGVEAGDEIHLEHDLWVRAVATHHSVPSLGWIFFRKVRRLAPEFRGLGSRELAELRKRGELVTEESELTELAFLTDTLATALDQTPAVMSAKVLVVECTFLDERADVERAHAGMHIHLDELIDRFDQIHSEHIVLMHLSQRYRPDEAAQIVAERCPPGMARRIQCLVPAGDRWPG